MGGVRTVAVAAAVSMMFAGAPAAAEAPSIADFAALPEVQSVAISPSGRYLAFLRNVGGGAIAQINDRTNGEMVQAISVGDLKARGVGWASDDYALLWVSDTQFDARFRSRTVEFTGVYSLDVRSGAAKQMLSSGNELSIGNNLGSVLGVGADGESLIMQAYAATRDDSGREFAVFDVSLSTGRATLRESGNRERTQTFFLDADGNVVARIDRDGRYDYFAILAKDGTSWRELYTQTDSVLAPYSIVGAAPDGASLLVFDDDENGDEIAAHLDLVTGTLSAAVFGGAGNQVDGVIRDPADGSILGVSFADIDGPRYDFYDDALDAMMANVAAKTGPASIYVRSVTADLQTWIFYVEDSSSAGAYLIYDRAADSLQRLAKTRPNIPAAAISPVLTITYPARDGQLIEALLTLPPGVTDPQELPLVVLPHGGPASQDVAGWDFMAQAIASRGYLVLQPNFRGSTGYGSVFEKAGHGAWGRGVAQHDITDGVTGLIEGGYADPARVCIAGWSYGGYAALAGAVFTPELYRCVIAGAGVSDLDAMIADEKRAYGRDSWIVEYWRTAMSGADAATRLRDASPVHFAADVRAPVLLIHGRDDTVVSIDQSRRMERALKRADKDVTFVELRGEDHHLSRAETRKAALEAMLSFLDEHIGGEPPR